MSASGGSDGLGPFPAKINLDRMSVCETIASGLVRQDIFYLPMMRLAPADLIPSFRMLVASMSDGSDRGPGDNQERKMPG